MGSRWRRTGWFGAIAVLMVGSLVLTVVLWIPRPVAGHAVPAESIARTGTGQDADRPLVTIRHVGIATTASRNDDEAVSGVLADLSSYWSATMPGLSGKPFAPLTGGFVSIDATAAAGSSWCVNKPDEIAGNAYYCAQGDAIVYDSAGLIPVLIGHYGVPGLTAALGHEFGHAIQARIGPTESDRSANPARYPSLLIEAQGDCFAGAFLAWVVSGRSTQVRLPAASLVRAVAPLLDFRDPVDVGPNDESAHGLGLDRLASLLQGYRGGASACHSLTASGLTPTLGRPGVLRSATTARFDDAGAVRRAARNSVGAFAARLSAAHPLTGVTESPSDLAAAHPYGQFAQAAAFALAAGRTWTTTAAGAACFAGSWAASVFGHAAPGGLGSWAGDADEALDMLRARPAATFDELTGYADGFARGWSACARL